jgi:hypothetical protein
LRKSERARVKKSRARGREAGKSASRRVYGWGDKTRRAQVPIAALAVFALRALVVSSTVPAGRRRAQTIVAGASRMSARVRAPARGTDQRPSRLPLVLARAPLNGTRVTEFSNPSGKVALNLTRARRRLRGSAMLVAERDRWGCRIRAHRERALLSHTLTGRRRSGTKPQRSTAAPPSTSHLSGREASATR